MAYLGVENVRTLGRGLALRPPSFCHILNTHFCLKILKRGENIEFRTVAPSPWCQVKIKLISTPQVYPEIAVQVTIYCPGKMYLPTYLGTFLPSASADNAEVV